MKNPISRNGMFAIPQGDQVQQWVDSLSEKHQRAGYMVWGLVQNMCHALVEQELEKEKRTYTVFVREASGHGTTYVDSCEADSVEEAKRKILVECSENWGENYPPEALCVIGVVHGDVCVVGNEWDMMEPGEAIMAYETA